MLFDPNTSVRTHERFEIVLPVRLRPARRTAERLRFRPGTVPPSGFLEGDLIDLSRGGVGIILPEFLPKGARAEMRICGLDGDPSRPLLVSKIRIQRSRMTDSRPAYLLGAAFVEIDAVFEHDLELLIARLRGEPADTPGNNAGRGVA
jgi:hypothetical protein